MKRQRILDMPRMSLLAHLHNAQPCRDRAHCSLYSDQKVFVVKPSPRLRHPTGQNQRHSVKNLTYPQHSTTPFSSNDTFTSRHNAILSTIVRSVRITFKPAHIPGVQHLPFSPPTIHLKKDPESLNQSLQDWTSESFTHPNTNPLPNQTSPTTPAFNMFACCKCGRANSTGKICRYCAHMICETCSLITGFVKLFDRRGL